MIDEERKRLALIQLARALQQENDDYEDAHIGEETCNKIEVEK